MKLQEHLDEFNSIYYILRCIENILLRSKQDNSLKESKIKKITVSCLTAMSFGTKVEKWQPWMLIFSVFLPHLVSKSLMATLEDSVLHLSKTFPLFTCYVWRIGGIISSCGNEKNMDLEQSWIEKS